MNSAAEPLSSLSEYHHCSGLVSSAKTVPRASAAISAAMATGEAMAFAPGRAALSYMMQGSLTRNGNHWELRWDPRSSRQFWVCCLSSGVFGEPQSFEGARQGVLGQCRLQPDDSNCSTIYVQVDLDRVAAS